MAMRGYFWVKEGSDMPWVVKSFKELTPRTKQEFRVMLAGIGSTRPAEG